MALKDKKNNKIKSGNMSKEVKIDVPLKSKSSLSRLKLMDDIRSLEKKLNEINNIVSHHGDGIRILSEDFYDYKDDLEKDINRINEKFKNQSSLMCDNIQNINKDINEHLLYNNKRIESGNIIDEIEKIKKIGIGTTFSVFCFLGYLLYRTL